MTDTDIRPALTPEQWAKKEALDTFLVGDDLCVEDRAWFYGSERHVVAALALYGQPFGFTHEDVAALRLAIDNLQAAAGELNWQPYPGQAVDALPGIADRIAALLPPSPAHE